MYITFSEDDLYRANTADLVTYLESRGEHVKKVGSTYQYIYTDGGGTHDSVTIYGGKWYDHKNQRGGYAVKFLQEFLGFSFQDSVTELLGGHCDAPTIRSALQEPPKPVVKPFELPEANSDMRRVFAYLTKQRFIASDVISFFAHHRKMYEDKKYHNVVFVGTDENGTPKQASVRSTLSFGDVFRITVANSDTKYSFSHFGKSGRLFVFEAPIDMLSFITLYHQNWQTHSYIAMNGVYENAVLEALKCHSNLNEVVLCTDNDVGGIDAADRLRDILRENGYANIFRIIPRNKDFNEDLKELHELTPIPAVPHLRKELFLENVSLLEFTSINLGRAADSLSVALSRNRYTDISNIALSASAEILAKVNEKSADDMFENLQRRLWKGYRAYTDRGKMFSKMDTLKKSHFEAVKNLRNYPATKEQMKDIAKSLYDLADSALKCSTEQKMSDQQEQGETPQQAVEIKMSI